MKTNCWSRADRAPHNFILLTVTLPDCLPRLGVPLQRTQNLPASQLPPFSDSAALHVKQELLSPDMGYFSVLVPLGSLHPSDRRLCLSEHRRLATNMREATSVVLQRLFATCAQCELGVTCVKLHLWFYNAFLRLVLNASWVTWPGALFRRAWGPLIASSFKIFDKDNPRHRPRQERSVSKSNLQLLYALNAITLAGQSATVFKLSSEASFATHLRKYRSYQGVLDSTKLHQGDLLALRHMLHYSSETIEAPLASTGNSFTAIVDTGCSITCTNSPHDFVPGTLRALPKPIILGGIAGGLQVREQGIVHWEFLNDFGMIETLETKAFLQEELPCRLLSPQAFLRHSSQNVSDNFRFFHDRAELHLRESRQLTFHYDSSFLPRITLFAHGTAQPSLLALYGSLVGDSNINLTPQTKHWLRWHYKLGHLAFEHVRLLGHGAFLDTLSLGLFKNATQGTPRCGACCFGKQQRKPDNVKTSSQRPITIGTLKREQLEPGDRIFSDQLESRIRGRRLHTAGREPEHDRFCGSSIFCNAASGLIHVEHQVTFSANDTIMAKNGFERFCKESGVTVKAYQTDNGVYRSMDFMRELAANSQAIRFSGVGAKWQNGIAENAIKIITTKARTMMIHSAIHWPDVDDKTLWPLAVSYAAHLYNHTPNATTGLAPIEIFTRTKSDHSVLKGAHPWGCPTYVLEPSLTHAGGKLPRWQPRSRRAQFVGISPMHADTIGLVRNLRTGFITPQYHLVFDDWFETVAATGSEPPAWENLCIYQRFQTVFDPGISPPSLNGEWTKDDLTSPSPVERRNDSSELPPPSSALPLHSPVHDSAPSSALPPHSPVHDGETREPVPDAQTPRTREDSHDPPRERVPMPTVAELSPPPSDGPSASIPPIQSIQGKTPSKAPPPRRSSRV